MSANRRDEALLPPPWRYGAVLGVMAAMAVTLVARAAELQLLDREFLVEKANARHVQVAEIPAHRGTITDRSGEPLAVSSPVRSVWANPARVLEHPAQLPQLAEALGTEPDELRKRLRERRDREFVYLERHMMPEQARRVAALEVPGLALQREYHRFYPAGEMAGHVIGFTNIDDHGQEGLERAYDDWLSGKAGRKKVIRDQLGRRVEDVELLEPAQPGRDLTLTIDRELQYLAYRELKRAVKRRGAVSGSVTVLDARSGDVLAMVNQPSFNPNRRADLEARRYRNRAVTDVFEPGSTLKPLTVAAALEEGGYEVTRTIDTAPGSLRVQGKRITDIRNYGTLDLRQILVKSSNVGAAKLALSLDDGTLWDVIGRFGFGQRTASGFPGEASGRLAARPSGRDIERATLAFGYGVSVSALQLARAYGAIANDGVQPRVSFVRDSDNTAADRGERVLSRATARKLRGMLSDVVSPEGTGSRADVTGYEVAGKTGTVQILGGKEYDEDRYRALFAGMAPASDPRFVVVVVVNDPSGDAYYGGEVAAPVFRRVAHGALRLYNVSPRDMPSRGDLLVAERGRR